jgi:uncharacterized NAD(P)/FAD-binding protein YdhS
VALEEVVDEHFLNRYRALLDAEDAAFDELEHAYEDGDREHFLIDLRAWERSVRARLAFLGRCGVALDGRALDGRSLDGATFGAAALDSVGAVT